MRMLRWFVLALFSVVALLQIVAAVGVAGRSGWMAGVFVVAALVLAAGVWRHSTTILVAGLVLALSAPLAVGLTGIERFEWAHHVVRLALFGVILGLWWWSTRRTAATEASPSGRRRDASA